MYSTLLDVTSLRALQQSGGPLIVFDVRFDLTRPEAGEQAYAQGHLPGARYAHLDRDLSTARTGRNGRHPLPERAHFAEWAGRQGIAPGIQVVAYDDQGGAFAARLWWMLRWLGHEAVAVLNGGLPAWVAAGGTLHADTPSATVPLASYPLSPEPAFGTVDADTLQADLGRYTVLDARAPARFRGEMEPLDPVAGHIPGARNRFYQLNLGPDGRFLPVADLRAAFTPWAPSSDSLGQPLVHQCGSGVTACHNLLAAAHAGLGAGLLYPGSWSEWCADPARPVARG